MERVYALCVIVARLGNGKVRLKFPIAERPIIMRPMLNFVTAARRAKFVDRAGIVLANSAQTAKRSSRAFQQSLHTFLKMRNSLCRLVRCYTIK
jgi:hypothetical protein